jgi:cobyrinic acid a,c-diamide synthase
MYLSRSIEVEQRDYAMVGLYPFRTRMLARRKALGYREVVLKKDSLLGPKGLRARGHEFHYSELINGRAEIADLYQVSNRKGMRAGPDGFRAYNTLGGYIHFHFGSNPEMAANFVQSCREYKNRT